jgi:hypothetical protein
VGIGKPGPDGMRPAKEVEHWGLVAIIGPRPDKIRVILRRVGTGNITLWSVSDRGLVVSHGNGSHGYYTDMDVSARILEVAGGCEGVIGPRCGSWWEGGLTLIALDSRA